MKSLRNDKCQKDEESKRKVKNGEAEEKARENTVPLGCFTISGDNSASLTQLTSALNQFTAAVGEVRLAEHKLQVGQIWHHIVRVGDTTALEQYAVEVQHNKEDAQLTPTVGMN